MSNAPVAGYVAPGFESVREAFAANVAAGLEVGVSFAVTRHGQPIVDLWGGHTDQSRSTALPRNALFNLFSTTKGLMSTCIALLVDRGKLSYEAPVAAYWPQFASHGKETVTVGQLMSHQAGLCGLREPVSLEDFYGHHRVATLLAAQEPYWKPGSTWGYHGLTIGILADELVRRVDGRSMGAFFATEIAAPLSLDAFMGLPETEVPRQVAMIGPVGGQLYPAFNPPNRAAFLALTENPKRGPECANTRAWSAAGLPSAAGSANARSVARLYSVLANGGELEGKSLLSARTIAEATRERIAGVDQAEGEYNRYAAGFQLNVEGNMGPNPQSFGHNGWGGSLAFADPQRRVGIAYVMNKMLIPDQPGGTDPRASRLLSATFAALEKSPAAR
jgi:CubicO group peptidase (beta-lactamase class C family)